MNWIQIKLCLFVLALLTPIFFVVGEDSNQTSFQDDEEMLPSDRSADSHDVAMMHTTSSTQSDGRVLRQSHTPNSNSNVDSGMQLQFTRGLFSAPLESQPLDAQPSSASKNVIFNSNNRNTFSDFARSAEETVKRLTRNPEALEDIVGHFQELGGGVTKNILQQVSQTAPDMSKSFGQALNEALTQTNILAQKAPGSNFNLTRLTQSLRQSNLPGRIDFGQLGQTLSQNFFAGATQNLLGSNSGQAQSESGAGGNNVAAEAPRATDTLGSAGTNAESEGNPEQDGNAASQSQNPFEQTVGHPLLPLGKLGHFGRLNPMSMLNQLAHLLALGSEISEVRVLPEKTSPYKVSPKSVDSQLKAEMKLKAVLTDALNKKTIPILWFHLPNNNKEQKTLEELELEEKLEHFEQQVIAELKQLQELAKMANEVKKFQLQNGFQPSASLTTQLNLFEIPLYNITLADIERTLKDEHVMILMQIAKKHNNSQRDQQATTKYITDLTGTPIKRQTTPNEETLKSMGKDDMLKMMKYAYRMAALHGHEMPWIKEKMSSLEDSDSAKWAIDSQQRQFMDQNTQMNDERKWLAEKEERMRFEGNRMMSPQMQQQNNDRQMMNNMDMSQKMYMQQPMHLQSNWAPMSDMLMKQMDDDRKWMAEREQHMRIEDNRMMMNSQMQQQEQQQQQNKDRQMMQEPTMNKMEMSKQMLMQQSQKLTSMSGMQTPMQQHQNRNNERQMMQSPMLNKLDMPKQMSMDMPQQMPMQQPRQMEPMPDMQMPVQQRQQINKEQQMMQPPMMNKVDMPRQLPKQRQQKQQQPVMTMQQIPERMPDMHTSQGKTSTKPKLASNETITNMNDAKMIEPKLAMMPENKARFKDPGTFNMAMLGNKAPQPRPPIYHHYYPVPGSPYNPHYGGYAKPLSPAHYHYSHAPNDYTFAYRTAIGDEQIAQMLRYEQPKPKLMMMKMRTPNNEEPTINPTETTNEKFSTGDLNRKHTKRLAKKQNESFRDNVAAYVVVLRNNDNRSSSSKSSSRSRRRRSTEYATLEPIDESSLDALRKTYKNSLKEITLNHNETPAEALMRYNAASIREALEKANKQPMEITAGETAEEVKGANVDGEVVDQHQHVVQQQVTKSLPQTYSLSENGQLVPVTASAEALVGSGPYITQPLTISYNPLQAALYDSAALQGESYNNIISKYHALGTTSNKLVAQNPYLQAYNSLVAAPYMDNNSVLSPQSYQLTNHATVDSTGKLAKTLVHQTPQLGSSNYLSTSNAVNRNTQHLPEFETLSAKPHYAVLKQNTYANAFSPLRQAQVQTMQSYRTERPHDSLSLETIVAVLKQQLVECCNKCKNDIFQTLDATLKRNHYADTSTDKPHTLTNRNPSDYEDLEYKQWLAQMSRKGYNREYLTKQHQQDYLKDGKLNLHVKDEPGFLHDIDNVFFKNSQSFKRETILPDIETVADGEIETVTAAMSVENKTESPKEEEEDDEVEYEADEAVAENNENVLTPAKQIAKEAKAKKSMKKTEKETESAKNKNDALDSKHTILNTTQTIELAESTTHSMYTLRGKFRPSKTNSLAFSSKQGKHFPTYKNINKLGHAHSVTSSQDKDTTDENIEEMLDIMHDISIRNTDGVEENFTTAMPSPATTTTRPLSTSATNIEWKTANRTASVDVTTSKKLSRRKSKSRKSPPKSANTQ